jgi:hypothetical protein
MLLYFSRLQYIADNIMYSTYQLYFAWSSVDGNIQYSHNGRIKI